MASLPKLLDFAYFVLNWWKSDKRQEIMKQSCKNMFILSELPFVCPDPNNIFNIKDNGAFAINMVVQNSLTQNW